MKLYIDTSDRDRVEVAVKKGDKVFCVKKFLAKYRQAEKLLVEIEKMLEVAEIKLKNIKEIKVENRGGSFTSLRIGVITANALGFGLGIPVTTVQGGDIKTGEDFSVIKPEYSQEPTITLKKNSL